MSVQKSKSFTAASVVLRQWHLAIVGWRLPIIREFFTWRWRRVQQIAPPSSQQTVCVHEQFYVTPDENRCNSSARFHETQMYDLEFLQNARARKKYPNISFCCCLILFVCSQFNNFKNDRAAIAQLGERQTEDLEVPSSILGHGMLLIQLRQPRRESQPRWCTRTEAFIAKCEQEE